MRETQRKDRLIILIGIALMALGAIACGSTTTEQLSEAVAPTAASEGDAAARSEAMDIAEEPAADGATAVTEAPATEAPAAATEALPTEAPEPTATADTAATAVDPEIINTGFGQEDRSVSYAFIVTNPNDDVGLEDLGYQVAVMDAAGAVIATDSNPIPALFPGATMGFAGDVFVEEGQVVDSITVQLSSPEAVASEPIPNFEVENEAYYPDDFFSHATGVISSPFDRQFADLRVSAITYDEADNIIGGGYTYVNFIPAGGSTGVRVSVTSSGDVARVEIYPSVSILSLFMDESVVPEGVEPVEIVADGFGVADFGAGFGMVITNPSTEYAIESSQYRVTAFGEDGTVLTTDDGYIELLLPGQTLGIGGDMFIPDDAVLTTIQTLFAPGDYIESEGLLEFTTENATFVPGSFSSEVNGMVNNPYTEQVTDLRVSAIAYDAEGTIIGGGYTYLDFVPAEGSAAVSVSMNTQDTPASVELFAALSGLSIIGDN